MADVISYQEMLYKNAELKRQNLFIFSVDGIDAWTVRTAARPHFTMTELKDQFLNQTAYYAGRGEWQEMPIELIDPIAPSSAQKVMEWLRLVYESETGRMGYKAIYAKNVTLKMIGPDGTIVEEWELINSWPKDIDGGALDMSQDATRVSMKFSLRFDRARLSY